MAELDILVIAPHPDDAELGMGGAILKFLREGKRVGVLDLTSGEPTPHGTDEIRQQETAAATRTLGLTWRDNLGLPNRSLEPTLEARRELAGVIRQTQPITWRLRNWSKRRGSGRSSPKATCPAYRIIRSGSTTTSACI